MGAIADEAALLTLYGAISRAAAAKVTDHLTPAYAAFVAASPFVVLASVGPDGVDVTPRGDPAGFVAVDDPHTLLMPDRRGNNRLDALRNILRDPRVSLLFLIPGVGETLRVVGRAEIRDDDDLRARFVHDGKEPATVLRVRIERVYFQCQKAVVRARLWDPEAHGAAPSAGAMLADAMAGPLDVAATDADYAERTKVLY